MNNHLWYIEEWGPGFVVRAWSSTATQNSEQSATPTACAAEQRELSQPQHSWWTWNIDHLGMLWMEYLHYNNKYWFYMKHLNKFDSRVRFFGEELLVQFVRGPASNSSSRHHNNHVLAGRRFIRRYDWQEPLESHQIDDVLRDHDIPIGVRNWQDLLKLSRRQLHRDNHVSIVVVFNLIEAIKVQMWR